MEDRWLSVDEIAEYLGVKRDTIYKYGRCPPIVLGDSGSLKKIRLIHGLRLERPVIIRE
jgi:predicted transcriptional regulator